MLPSDVKYNLEPEPIGAISLKLFFHFYKDNSGLFDECKRENSPKLLLSKKIQVSLFVIFDITVERTLVKFQLAAYLGNRHLIHLIHMFGQFYFMSHLRSHAGRPSQFFPFIYRFVQSFGDTQSCNILSEAVQAREQIYDLGIFRLDLQFIFIDRFKPYPFLQYFAYDG